MKMLKLVLIRLLRTFFIGGYKCTRLVPTMFMNNFITVLSTLGAF